MGTPEKKLPTSVQALKKKYTEQRLARSVFTKNLQTASRRTRSQTHETSPKAKLRGKKSGLAKPNERGKSESSRLSTRSSSALPVKQVENASRRQRKLEDGRKSERIKAVAKAISTRKPSAAAIVARRKTRMATLTTAASSRASRMLTRLTPRGTSSANFVKTTLRKSLPLERQRSLRGRDISLSSEEEEDDESDDDDDGNKDRQKQSSNASRKDIKANSHVPKKKLKSRTHLSGAKKKSEESEDEDADEETSSRDSSRRPSKQRGLDVNSVTNSPSSKRFKKGDRE